MRTALVRNFLELSGALLNPSVPDIYTAKAHRGADVATNDVPTLILSSVHLDRLFYTTIYSLKI